MLGSSPLKDRVYVQSLDSTSFPQLNENDINHLGKDLHNYARSSCQPCHSADTSFCSSSNDFGEDTRTGQGSTYLKVACSRPRQLRMREYLVWC